MFRAGQSWACAWLLCSAAALGATPADEHARGLRAYQQGDVATAMQLLRGPANAGHAASRALLAFILDSADFAAEAVPLYRAAAAQGDADAHAGLANLYLQGRGIAKDEKQALAHFSKAAELGHAASIAVMARAWREGRMGLKPDAAEAARWQARAASPAASAGATKAGP